MKQTKYTAAIFSGRQRKTYTVYCIGFFAAFALICVEIHNDGWLIPGVMSIEDEYGNNKILSLSIS